MSKVIDSIATTACSVASSTDQIGIAFFQGVSAALGCPTAFHDATKSRSARCFSEKRNRIVCRHAPWAGSN